jgi:hypothetical protein
VGVLGGREATDALPLETAAKVVDFGACSVIVDASVERVEGGVLCEKDVNWDARARAEFSAMTCLLFLESMGPESGKARGLNWGGKTREPIKEEKKFTTGAIL